MCDTIKLCLADILYMQNQIFFESHPNLFGVKFYSFSINRGYKHWFLKQNWWTSSYLAKLDLYKCMPASIFSLSIKKSFQQKEFSTWLYYFSFELITYQNNILLLFKLIYAHFISKHKVISSYLLQDKCSKQSGDYQLATFPNTDWQLDALERFTVFAMWFLIFWQEF